MLPERLFSNKYLEYAALGAAFLYLGRQLFNAQFRRPSHLGRTMIVTPDNVDQLPYESERETARLLLKLYPASRIVYEPFDVHLENSDYDEGQLIHGQKRMTPDFSVDGRILEVGLGDPDSQHKQAQARVAKLAGMQRYTQIVGDSLIRLLSSDNPHDTMDEVSGGLLR